MPSESVKQECSEKMSSKQDFVTRVSRIEYSAELAPKHRQPKAAADGQFPQPELQVSTARNNKRERGRVQTKQTKYKVCLVQALKKKLSTDLRSAEKNYKQITSKSPKRKETANLDVFGAKHEFSATKLKAASSPFSLSPSACTFFFPLVWPLMPCGTVLLN